MKKIITAFLVVCFLATVAYADWLADFMENYTNKGIDFAVEKAVKQDISTTDIMEQGLLIQTLTPPDLVKALYCAGVTGEDIYNAAQDFSVSELIIAEGFTKAKVECGDIVTDTQPYTPVIRPGRDFGPDQGRSGRVFTSPSTP